MLSTFLLGVGCGENVLVGSLQLRSLTDAGADVSEAVDGDAGSGLQSAAAEAARKKAACKAERGDNRCDDKTSH